MISLLVLFLPAIYSQGTEVCNDANGNKCFGDLSDLQSSQQCGNAALVPNEMMGHKMPSNENWMQCACGKLPNIVDCLEKSTCASHRQAAEDFSGVVNHCNMDHGGTMSHASASASATASSNSSTPSSTPGSDAGAISPIINMGLVALGLMALA
jgi:hypothetical protein